MNEVIIKLYPLSFFVFFVVLFEFLSTNFIAAEQDASIEGVRSQIERIEKDLLEQQEELKNIDIREKDILGELEKLEKNISAHRKSLNGLSGNIKRVSKEIQVHERRIRELNKASKDAREYLRERLVAFYKFGRLGYISLLATADNLQEFQRTIKYMKSIMAKDKEILDRLGKHMNQVENELDMLKKNKAEFVVLQEAKNTEMEKIEQSIGKKVFLLMKARNEKGFYAKAVKELKEASHALNNTVLDLEQRERGELLSGSFSEMKGKLPLPLKGEIMRDVEQLDSNPFIHRKGVFIGGFMGEEIKSIFSGKIEYSGWFKGYGQLVIINHGSHYFTIFAHLEERLREEGDMVSDGDVIGLAGDPGWHIGPGVYFEMRKGGENLEPERWLKTK
ncbi:MAG TPA: peptidoglycan DD-metalloendopeptidase family protein [Desulfatiglandales bacterium]|nr:peptidoglycan DD-metalloendopeptidase family protein [Desulfatiglandales bacterium]